MVHGHAGQQVPDHGLGPAFNVNCDECGSLCCYVDDSTYLSSSSDPRVLSEKLSEQYGKLASYMGDNRLVINDDKTHCW